MGCAAMTTGPPPGHSVEGGFSDLLNTMPCMISPAQLQHARKHDEDGSSVVVDET